MGNQMATQPHKDCGRRHRRQSEEMRGGCPVGGVRPHRDSQTRGIGSDHLHGIPDLPRRVGIVDAGIDQGGTFEHRVQVARHLLRILCVRRLLVLELSRRNVEAPGFEIRETAMNGTVTWNMSSQGFQVDHRLVVVLGGQ